MGSSKDRERTNFIGMIIPRDIKLFIKELKKCDPAMVEDLIEVAKRDLAAAEEETLKEEFKNVMKKHSKVCMTVYPGLLHLLQLAHRSSSKHMNKKYFKQDLTEINVPEKYHNMLAAAVFENKSEIERSITAQSPKHDTLKSFRWRIDVAISTASLNRVLEQSILTKLETSNGKEVTFEMSKEKFHELRHSVAFVLNQMQQLEKRSVLQIDS